MIPNGAFGANVSDSMEYWHGNYLGFHLNRGTVPSNPLAFQYPDVSNGYVGLELYSVLPEGDQIQYHIWVQLSDTVFPGDELQLAYSTSLADESAFYGGALEVGFFSDKPDSVALVDGFWEFSVRGMGSIQDTSQWIRENFTIIATDTVYYMGLVKSPSPPGPIAGTPTYQIGAMYLFDNFSLINMTTTSTVGVLEETWEAIGDPRDVLGRPWTPGAGLKIIMEKSNYGNFRTRKTLSL